MSDHDVRGVLVISTCGADRQYIRNSTNCTKSLYTKMTDITLTRAVRHDLGDGLMCDINTLANFIDVCDDARQNGQLRPSFVVAGVDPRRRG